MLTISSTAHAVRRYAAALDDAAQALVYLDQELPVLTDEQRTLLEVARTCMQGDLRRLALYARSPEDDPKMLAAAAAAIDATEGLGEIVTDFYRTHLHAEPRTRAPHA